MNRGSLPSRSQELKRRYVDAFRRASEILFSEDPIHINFGGNRDEYEPEVGTILPRLVACSSVDAVRQLVHEQFVRWFGPHTAGDEGSYERIAERLWTEVLPGLRG
ncbi:MAG: hypothetical protein RL885_31230 [Planctomycetota bacterium]